MPWVTQQRTDAPLSASKLAAATVKARRPEGDGQGASFSFLVGSVEN